MNTNDWENWVPIQSEDELLTVEATGMGCLLMRTSVFQSLKKPYFEYTFQPSTKDWLGEDFTLFKKLNSLGYKLKIDMNLSNEIYHMGTYAYGKNLLANTQKKSEWKSKKKKN
jgi:hypothetical protein